MIQIGDVLTLEPKHSDQLERYKCKMVEKKGNDILIDYPLNLSTGRTVFLLDGTQLKATFVGQDGSVYLFETEIIGRVKQNIPMLMLSFPGPDQLIKIQRRQYVRVDTSIDVSVRYQEGDFSPFTAITDDISAGGAAVLVPKEVPLKDGMFIKTLFVLPFQNGEYHYLDVHSQIIRVIETNETRNKVSLQFHEIGSYERQLLLRLSFERQLAIRKKGL